VLDKNTGTECRRIAGMPQESPSMHVSAEHTVYQIHDRQILITRAGDAKPRAVDMSRYKGMGWPKIVEPDRFMVSATRQQGDSAQNVILSLDAQGAIQEVPVDRSGGLFWAKKNWLVYQKLDGWKHRLICMNAVTGALWWQVNIGDLADDGLQISPDGEKIFVLTDRVLYALATAPDTEILWCNKIDCDEINHMRCDPQGHNIYGTHPTYNDRIVIFDAHTGKKRFLPGHLPRVRIRDVSDTTVYVQ
jgi:hypothetical protein